MSKHTPTPWFVAKCFSGDSCWCRLIVSAPAPTLPNGDYKLEDCVIASGSVGEANAAFIVRAVNAHEGLVRALKLCAAVCAGETMDKNGLIAALEAARAALSAAKE